jgi:hypothetical protein
MPATMIARARLVASALPTPGCRGLPATAQGSRPDAGRRPLSGGAEDQGRGVVAAAWKETKVACCQTLSPPESAKVPQHEPPRNFLEPTAVAPLVSTMKTRQSAGRSEKPAQRLPAPDAPSMVGHGASTHGTMRARAASVCRSAS